MMSRSVQALLNTSIYYIYIWYFVEISWINIWDTYGIALKVKVICNVYIWKQYVYIYKLKVHCRISVRMVACVRQCEDEFLLGFIAYSGWGPGAWPWPMATFIYAVVGT